MPGRKRGFTGKRPDIYEAVKRTGKSKKIAAMIANKARTKAGRVAMARKAAATRKRRSR
jgi:hypothetical protein